LLCQGVDQKFISNLLFLDRLDITEPAKVETQQEVIAEALNAYVDSEHKMRNRFAHIMAFLPRLRTLNVLCTQAFSKVQVGLNKNIFFQFFLRFAVLLVYLPRCLDQKTAK